MVVSLTISVEFTPQEQKAYEELKKTEVYRSLKIKALNLIRFSMKLRSFPEKRENIKDPDMRLKYIKTFDQLKHSLNEFTINRKFLLSREHETGAENILYKLNENVGNEMENIIVISNREVTTLLDYLKLTQTIQTEIDNYMEKLDKMTEGLEKCLDAQEPQEALEAPTLPIEKKRRFITKVIKEENDEELLGSFSCQDENEQQSETKIDKKDENVDDDINKENNKGDESVDLDDYSNGEIDRMHQKLIDLKRMSRISIQKKDIGLDYKSEEGSQESKGNLKAAEDKNISLNFANYNNNEIDRNILDIKPVEEEGDPNLLRFLDRSLSIEVINEQADSEACSPVGFQKSPTCKTNSVNDGNSFSSKSEKE